LALQTLKHHINGRWETGATLGTRENPSDLSEVVAQFARADAAQAASAVRAASDARAAWAHSTPQRRFEVLDTIGSELLARKDELARLVAREAGLTLREAVAECASAARLFKGFAGEALRLPGERLPSVREGVDVELLREPVGVVAAITPGSSPLVIPAAAIAPALACGNTVVFKPSELVPASASALAEIVSRSGLPAGVFNLVMGSGRLVGQALVESPLVDAIAFTGAAAAAQAVHKGASARGAKVMARWGGENVLVVLDDADPATAVACAVDSAFAAAGQGGAAARRMIVAPGLFDRFVRALRERTQSLVVGHALRPGTEVGPLATRERLERVQARLEAARADGAQWLAGGERLQRETRGHFLSPALLLGGPQHRVVREAAPGPVASVVRAEGYEHALALLNDSPGAPRAALCTTSLKHAEHFKRHARAAVALLNLPTTCAQLLAPVGARQAIEFHTVVKTAYTQA
jgi:aldehyde dehydrogenase (NAD+)